MTMLIVGALLSLLAGVSLGLLGGGGSILTVPILVYVLGIEPRSAIATSLVVVGATAAIAAGAHARAGRVRWKVGALFGLAGMAGAFAGGHLGHYIPPALLLVGFAAMVLVTAVAMLRPRRSPAETPAPQATGARRGLLVLRNGFGVGLLTGLIGAGGGFMVVPALVLLGGLEMSAAVATSLLVIALNSASGLVSTQLAGVPVNWPLALAMTVASIGGSLVGERFGRRLSPRTLRRAFALFVMVLGAFILARELPHVLHVSFLPVAAVAAVLTGAGVALAVRSFRRTAQPPAEVKSAHVTSQPIEVSTVSG